MMKHGLVLEGGGMRCMYTVGILDVFMENKLHFDGIIGVSAGAAFGCNYKSKQIGRALRYNKRFAKDPRYSGFRSWITTGDLINKQMAYNDVPIKYDPFDMETFLKNPMRFELVCTNVENAEPVYHVLENGDIHEFLEWIRASASMPLVSNAVEIGEYKLLDGGISDSIPLKHFQEEGFEKNIVILSQPAGFRKKQTKLTPIFKLFCKYPAIVDAMARRHKMYNAELDYIEAEKKKGNTFLIYPEMKLNIGRAEMDTDKMDKVYNMGRKKGEEILGEVIEFLKD